MPELTASFLLDNPDLVSPEAPWCVTMDNLELGLLALTLPWVAGPGLRRAEAERRLAQLATELPVGPVYFQRVSRTLAHLEARGAVTGTGSGRARRFAASPQGFAALILNLQVLRADPTLEGSEFELKRALVALCNLVLDRLSGSAGDSGLDPGLEIFFEQVEALEIRGRPVMTDELMSGAFDILGLIDLQRSRVRSMAEQTEKRLAQTRARAGLLRELGLPGSSPPAVTLTREAADSLLCLAAETIPALGQRAQLVRFQAYLGYLDRLHALYSHELAVVDLSLLRGAGRA